MMDAESAGRNGLGLGKTFVGKRPPETFGLLAYNQERYVREAIESAFAQTYDSLEVILSDDCSTDRTLAIMRQMARDYTGPHRVSVNRTPANLGLCGHVNAVFSLATTDILVLAAGDDVSLPGRVSDTVGIFQRNPGAVSVSLQVRSFDSSGRFLRPGRPFVREGPFTLEDFSRGDRPTGLGATRAYLRSVYTVFGPLSGRCRVEDAALVFRALLLGTVWHSGRVGVNYRVHKRNLSYGIDASAIKGLVRQHSTDLKVAERELRLPPDVLRRTREALRTLMVRGVIMDRFNKSRFKICVLVRLILFSGRFSFRAKQEYLRSAVRQLVPLRGDLAGRRS